MFGSLLSKTFQFGKFWFFFRFVGSSFVLYTSSKEKKSMYFYLWLTGVKVWKRILLLRNLHPLVKAGKYFVSLHNHCWKIYKTCCFVSFKLKTSVTKWIPTGESATLKNRSTELLIPHNWFLLWCYFYFSLFS